jgi:hypothetical protein
VTEEPEEDSYQSPVPKDSRTTKDTTPEYIVEKVLAYRVNAKGAKEYLLKWKGYSEFGQFLGAIRKPECCFAALY